MIAQKIFATFFLLAIPLFSMGFDLLPGKTEGSIIIISNGKNYEYFDIIGLRHGIDREISSINSKPALRTFSRNQLYLTITEDTEDHIIDCAYSDTRNKYNGARVQIAECGLRLPLRENYTDTAQVSMYEIEKLRFSFNTESVIAESQDTSFLIGKIGEVEIYDRYTSLASLEAFSPDRYIKTPNGCHHFEKGSTFVVFIKGNKDPKYIDLIDNREPIIISRLTEHELKSLATSPYYQ